MNKEILFLVSTICVLMIAASIQAGSSSYSPNLKIDKTIAEILSNETDERIPIIVMFNARSDLNTALEFHNNVSAPFFSDESAIKYKYTLIPGLAAEATAKSIKRLAEDNRVSQIYFDSNTQISASTENSSSDAYSINQTNHPNDNYISPAKIIKADILWEKGIDGKGITVAVIDSGIDKNHPDLIGRVVAEKNFLADEITTDDLLGHGTMVAGIIAGSGAASDGRYKGIAPGASLLSVKVIDRQGDGRVSDIIAGIEWAVQNGADVLCLSLGGINLGETNPPITMAADNAANSGAVVCVAAGNRNSTETQGMVRRTLTEEFENSTAKVKNADTSIEISQMERRGNKDVKLLFVPVVLALPPGLIDSPGDGIKVITVGATDKKSHIASFSGSGPTRDDRIKPDVVAPGVDIVSIIPLGIKRPDSVDDYYSIESGTSLSAPIAAGLSALLLQANENLTAAGVKAAMVSGASRLNNTQGDSYEEYYQGTGMLDALASYEILQNHGEIFGVIPDHWTPGRWAYQPAGKGVYVGLDTGADRPQKKLYALAPGDEDWNLRFVFLSDKDIKTLKASVKGDISKWISLQALPETILANDQKVFAASITVPQNAAPGIHNGTIEISSESENLVDIPVNVNVASLLDISSGLGNGTGLLAGNAWNYYYLEMMPGTTEFEASLDWQQQNTNLDIFLLSPTSEFYIGDKSSRPETKKIKNPQSGRWLIAVHNENVTQSVDYVLQVTRSQLEVYPSYWNLESAATGITSRTQFALKNFGLPLNNLKYEGMIENTALDELEGKVLYKKVWEYTVNSTQTTKKFSAKLLSNDKTDSSELMLVFENPDGEPVDALLGTGNQGPLEISNPDKGAWKVKVYGYEVPVEGQSFSVLLKRYTEDPWSWIETQGPQKMDSNENATLEANLTIPKYASLPSLDGYIKISSGNYNFEIPVSVTIRGTKIEGLSKEEVSDNNNDGLLDVLTLTFSLNITSPGEFLLRGILADSLDNTIANIDEEFVLNNSGSIKVNVSGADIWRKGKLGPMCIQNLVLYDKNENYIDRFDKKIVIKREPKHFQPPAAYLTGEITNRTTPEYIAFGANVTVINPGQYELHGSIVDNYDEKLDEKNVQIKLPIGNATIVLQFEPTQFVNNGEVTSIHLVNLALSREGKELDNIYDAGSLENLDPHAFKSAETGKGHSTVKLGGPNGIRWKNSTTSH